MKCTQVMSDTSHEIIDQLTCLLWHWIGYHIKWQIKI